MNLQTLDAATSGASPTMFFEHLERVKLVHFAHQDLERELFDKVATLDDQLIARKRAISKPALAVIFRQSSNLVTCQSLRSLLGHGRLVQRRARARF